MRLLRLALAPIFAAALIASYFTHGGWFVYFAVVVGISMLGGLLIARRWAVAVAFVVNLAFSALLVIALDTEFTGRELAHTVRLFAMLMLGQTVLSTTATAVAVQLRRTLRSGYA